MRGNREENSGRKKERIRTAAYCRVSTLSEQQEESFETQQRVYEAAIRENPEYLYVGVYGDWGSSGGTMDGRLEFQRLMRDCREGKIDLILTKSVSRFGRNLAELLECVRELKELGVSVQFEREGVDTMTQQGELLLSALAAVAQEELNSLSSAVRWANRENNRRGNPTRRTVYGYRKKNCGGERHVWCICEEEAALVRLAFARAEEGVSYAQICRELNAVDPGPTSRGWYHTRLLRLLQNEAYCGDLLTGKFVTTDYLYKKKIRNDGRGEQYYLKDHHPAIVEREQFSRVQQRIMKGAGENRRGVICGGEELWGELTKRGKQESM